MANYYNPYGYQNYIPYQQNYQQVQQQPSIHNGGMVSVRSEQEARNYPVAPQTSVMFHNENEPYIYTKTVGSSLEAPRFEKFKLVKENISEETAAESKDVTYVEKSEFDALKAEFEAFKEQITKPKKEKVKKDE